MPFNHGFIELCEVVTSRGGPRRVSDAGFGRRGRRLREGHCLHAGRGRSVIAGKRVGSTYNLINVTLGGTDPRLNKPYVMYMWNEGGFGGGPDMDGGDAPTMAMFATGSRNQPVEVHERFSRSSTPNWR